MNYWATRVQYEVRKNSTMSQLRRDVGEKKKEKESGLARDHRAETRTARFAGWKLVIKIPAVALARENGGERNPGFSGVPRRGGQGGLMCSNVGGV